MTLSPRLSGPAADLLRTASERIVITGASGWIGRATLELLYNTLGAQPFAERVFAFGSTSRVIDFRAATIHQRPLPALLALPCQPTLVAHLAFLTKDKVAGMDEAEYRRLNKGLRHTVLEALDMIGATAAFVASSGAVEFAADPEASAAMRLYGALKKADEDAFAKWAVEHGRRVTIGRIFALSGPHINKPETYALASFIGDAIAGRPITIRADFPVYRSYVAIRELMSLVFATMLDETVDVLRFSTGGERLEMQEIAQVVSETVGPVRISRPTLKTGKLDEYVGNDAHYRQLLRQYGVDHVPFAEQVAETAASFEPKPLIEKRQTHA